MPAIAPPPSPDEPPEAGVGVDEGVDVGVDVAKAVDSEGGDSPGLYCIDDAVIKLAWLARVYVEFCIFVSALRIPSFKPLNHTGLMTPII
jgi:hypothetical protein